MSVPGNVTLPASGYRRLWSRSRSEAHVKGLNCEPSVPSPNVTLAVTPAPAGRSTVKASSSGRPSPSVSSICQGMSAPSIFTEASGSVFPQKIPFKGMVTPTAWRGAADGLETVTSNCAAACDATAHAAAVNVRIERKVFIMKLCYGY